MTTSLRFRRLGRGFHPVIDDAAALAAVPDLQDAQWVATAATIDTLRCDPGLLALLDGDHDGRIRSDDLRAAVRWMGAHLSDTRGVDTASDTLLLSAVRKDAAEGPAILDAARRMLRDLGTADADRISLAAVRERRAREEARGLSEAGRVLPAAAGEDAALAAFLARIVAVTGGEPHPLGEPAVSAATLERFQAEGAAWLAWHDLGTLAPGQDHSELLLLGPDTAAAAAALDAVQAKLDQYFLLCDAVALDPNLAQHAWVDATGANLLEAEVARGLLARAPLARPREDGILDTQGALNPAWRAAVQALIAAAGPLLGAQAAHELTRPAVEALQARLAPFRAWRDGQPPAAVGSEGAEGLRAMLADATLVERTRGLLQQSEVAAAELAGVKAVEQLLLYQGGLLRLANSMVAMPDLFDDGKHALFEQGTLILDGRIFGFAIRVNDVARAERFAGRSPLCTMFVQVGEKGSALDRELMIPITAGERGHVVEGMWGVFYGLDGKEHHALVRKLAVNPISIREALLAPFRKLSETLQNMADKAASEKTAAMDATVTSHAQTAVDSSAKATETAVAAGAAAPATVAVAPVAAPAAAAPAAAAPARPGMAGQLPMLLAGGGLALAALSSAAAYVVEMIWGGARSLADGFMGLPVVSAMPPGGASVVQVLSTPVALLIILLGVVLVPFLIYAIPVSIATWLRLRRRDLTTLLEGSGWAINTRVYLDHEQAKRFTSTPVVSPSSLVR